MNKFEEEIAKILKSKGFDVKSEQKYIDLIIEKNGIKIAVEIKSEQNLTPILPKAFGQLMAAKYIYKPDELWLILKTKDLHALTYFKILKENDIKIFSIENTELIEIKNIANLKRDRKVKSGIDYSKLVKIWNALAEAGDWLHIAEISRRTNIDECTVRWYLDRYLNKAIDEQRIHPTIKLRLVKLKPGMDLEHYIKALKVIKEGKAD